MRGGRDGRGGAMPDVEVREGLGTLLLAGHETTATALAWAFDLLLANPDTLERLQSDLAAGRDESPEAVRWLELFDALGEELAISPEARG